MGNDEIETFLESIEKSAKALKQEILTMCWHMRGGLTYDEAMMLSPDERIIIGDIVKDHMETTKKTGLPFF